MAVEDYLKEYKWIWVAVEGDRVAFLEQLYYQGIIDQATYNQEMLLVMAMPVPEEWEYPPTIEAAREQIGDVLFHQRKGYFATAFHEVLVSLWKWMIDKMKELIDLVVGVLKPVLEEVWELAKKVLTEAAMKVFEGAEGLFEGHSPVAPEDAPIIAGKLYAMAWGAGMLAQGIAATCETVHPLKELGIHHTAAMVGDFAQFGRIAGATMGPLVNKVLGQLVTYNVLNKYRPMIPMDWLLIELRSKREIDYKMFDKNMGYQGYSSEWIKLIERWQWKDPRMFEICRLADVGIRAGDEPTAERAWTKKFGLPTVKGKDWWLQRKFMRAGYEDVDIPVMIEFIHRREAAFAYTYVRTAIRRNYRYGYLTLAGLDNWMERLGLPDEARVWIRWASDLDREYFYQRDLESHYVLAFRNDVISEDELTVSLLAMGLPAKQVVLTVRTERVRKRPKVSKPVPKPAKKAMTDVQKKYITLYITQYRKGLIPDSILLESLLAIGLEPELAEISVDIEAAKKGLLLPA